MIRWVHAIDKPVSEAAYSTNTLAGPAERQAIQPRPLGIGRISSFTFFYSLVTKGNGRLMELKCLVESPGTGLARLADTAKCPILLDLMYFSH